MGFMGLANLYAMRVNLSVAIVAMTNTGNYDLYHCYHLAFFKTKSFKFCFLKWFARNKMIGPFGHFLAFLNVEENSIF